MQCVEHVAAVVEGHRIDQGFTAGELQSLAFERMVPAPVAHETFKRFARCDAHLSASRKLLSVRRHCRFVLANLLLSPSHRAIENRATTDIGRTARDEMDRNMAAASRLSAVRATCAALSDASRRRTIRRPKASIGLRTSEGRIRAT